MMIIIMRIKQSYDAAVSNSMQIISSYICAIVLNFYQSQSFDISIIANIFFTVADTNESSFDIATDTIIIIL